MCYTVQKKYTAKLAFLSDGLEIGIFDVQKAYASQESNKRTEVFHSKSPTKSRLYRRGGQQGLSRAYILLFIRTDLVPKPKTN